VIVTGGHGTEAVDWLYDGERHVPIAVERHGNEATHGAGCTHSAALTAFLARGESLEEAARAAARIASEAVRAGLAEIGAGSGPVDVFGLDAPVRAR
jgi:hydroxymethylpyrimidine/phosphomethylpyrimidine kinase